MRRITTLWSYLLTLLVAVTMSTAQETITLSALRSDASTSLRAGKTLSGFGYADRYSSDLDYVGIGQTGIYLSGYIKLPDVGANRITKISFPAAKADANAYILILSEDGKTTLYNQKCSIVAGNNEIALTTPFATEAGKRYRAGFATKAVGNGEKDPFLIPFDGSAYIEEATYVAVGTDPYPTPQSTSQTFVYVAAKDFGAACIYVTLDNQSALQDLGYLIGVAGNFELVKKDQKVSTIVSLRNIGVNEISSIELTYQFGTGETKSISQTLTTALAPSKTGEYTFEIPAIGDGLGTVHFAISKINGKENVYADQQIDSPFKIGKFDAISRETVLLERFTAEWCGYCPGADRPVNALIKKLTEAGLRVSYVIHRQGDYFTLPESEKLARYFFPRQGGGIPAMSINRTYMSEADALVIHASGYNPAEWTKKMKDDKQGVKIEKIVPTAAKGKLKVVISGVALKGCFDPEDLYLTVILTQDDVASRNQNGASRNYKHEAMPRLFLTNALGDKITPAADGSFSVTLEGTLKPTWEGGQGKIVAIAHPSIQQNDKKKRAIYTAETVPLDYVLANEEVAPVKAPTVSEEDGYLSILGHVDAFELYDMSGALVTTSAGTRLEPGVYAIRIFSNLRVYTYKVIVR